MSVSPRFTFTCLLFFSTINLNSSNAFAGGCSYNYGYTDISNHTVFITPNDTITISCKSELPFFLYLNCTGPQPPTGAYQWALNGNPINIVFTGTILNAEYNCTLFQEGNYDLSLTGNGSIVSFFLHLNCNQIAPLTPLIDLNTAPVDPSILYKNIQIYSSSGQLIINISNSSCQDAFYKLSSNNFDQILIVILQSENSVETKKIFLSEK